MKGYLAYIIFIIAGILLYTLDFFLLKKHQKTKFIPLLIMLLLFFILATFKYSSVGIVSKTYENMYPVIINNGFIDILKKYKLEIGFYGLMYTFAKVGLPYLVFKGFCYFIESCFLFLAFQKKDNNVFTLSLLMFIGFLSMSFSALRQGISIAILSFAFSFASLEQTQKRKNTINAIIYSIMVIISSTFHATSIVSLSLFPFFFVKKIGRNTQILLLISLLIIPRISFAFFTLFSGITGYDYVAYTSRISGRFILYVFVLIAYIVLKQNSILNSKFSNYIKPIAENNLDNFTFFMAYLCLIFSSYNTFSQILARMSFYFIYGVVYFISRETSCIIKNKWRFLIEIAIIFVFGLYFLIDTKTLGIYPYEFI